MSFWYDFGLISRRPFSGRNAIRVICCLVTVVVVDSHVIRSERSTSNLPHGLNSPCGPSIGGAAPVFTIGSLQRNDVLSKLEEVRILTDRLRRQIGLMPLPEIFSQEIIGLPGPEDISSYRNLTVDYTVVSHLLVFVDIVITDQGTPHALWQELRRHILSISCDMYKGMPNTPYISNDITLPCVREASCGNPRSRFTRDRRSFVITSAVRDVFNRLYQTYSLLPVQ